MPAETPIGALVRQAQTSPGAAAVDGPDGSLTWLELERRVAALSALLGTRGVRAGDRVLVAWPPGCAWVTSALAVLAAQAVVVPVDPQAPKAQAQRLTATIEPHLILGPIDSGERYGPEPLDALPPGAGEALDDRTAADPAQPGLIVPTSGTTGQPKAAVHSQRTMQLAGEGFAYWLALTPEDRVFSCLPLFHVNAIFYSWLGALAAGSALVFSDGFSASRFWDDVRAARASEVNLIGSMLEMLLRRSTPADAAGHGLRVVYSAGAGAAVHQRFEEAFGVRVVEGYGLSETPYGCINGIDERRLGSLGRVREHPRGLVANEVAVVDAEGNPLGPGEEGEIVIRNNATFSGYWRDPEATARAFRDGWLLTRDLGSCDEAGYFWFRGRLGDVIRRNGVNISPVEIERWLADAPWISASAVVGMPDEVSGEQVVVVVVPASGVSDADASERTLAEARAQLRSEQVPDRVVVAAELPFTVTGRVQRAKLRKWLTTNQALT